MHEIKVMIDGKCIGELPAVLAMISDLKAEIARLREERRLIPVGERLPEDDQAVDAPQPAPDWLTPEGRKAMESARLHLSNVDWCDQATERDCKWASDVFGRLLARSTPPVVVPEFVAVEDWHTRDRKWLAALAAAGVTVKEVGRE